MPSPVRSSRSSSGTAWSSHKTRSFRFSPLPAVIRIRRTRWSAVSARTRTRRWCCIIPTVHRRRCCVPCTRWSAVCTTTRLPVCITVRCTVCITVRCTVRCTVRHTITLLSVIHQPSPPSVLSSSALASIRVTSPAASAVNASSKSLQNSEQNATAAS